MGGAPQRRPPQASGCQAGAWAARSRRPGGGGGSGVGGPASFNALTKPHLQVNAAAHSPLPSPGALCPARARSSRQMAAEMLISGAPRPPRLIAPLQMGRECALHADERGLAAGGLQAGCPGAGSRGPGGEGGRAEGGGGRRKRGRGAPPSAPPGTSGHPAGRAREARFSLFISPKWDLK